MGTAGTGRAQANMDAIASSERMDQIFKALSSRPRRQILSLLAAGTGEGGPRCCSAEELCACEIVERLGLGAPTVSHHMKSLIDAGLVSSEKRGSWVYYRLRLDTVQCVADELMALIGCATPACS